MTRNLVITGVDGFVGRHLARIAAEAGWDVFGVSRSTQVDADLSASLSGYASADLRQGWPDAAPTEAAIVHLAGLAAVGASFDRPQDYIDGNSAMVTNMCESLLKARDDARIIGVSTGAVYAQRDDDPARSERDPIAFTSPYVVSKILVENQPAYYARRGLDTVVARPFNHIGPGQGPGFLLPDLLAQLRRIAPSEPLRVGDLTTRRDYTDVRDVARAYLALAAAAELPDPVYNIASGVSRSGKELLAALCTATGTPQPRLTVDASRIRATDPAIIVGDATRLRDATGWAPLVPFDQTVTDAVG